MKMTFGSLLPCCVLTLASTQAVAQATTCKTADPTSARIISAIKSIMSPTNKVRLYAKVPLVSPTEITLVLNDSTCARARDVLNANAYSPDPPPNPLPEWQVYVVQVGTYFATFDPEQRAGEWHIIGFFDSAWNYVGSMIPF